MKTLRERLTDEELAELEHVCKSWATRRAGDSFVYVAASVFGGLASLLAEVRELRKLVPTEEEEREWRAFHEDMFPGGCGFERQMRGEDLRGKVVKQMYDVAEVEELRAFKGRVDAVINCDRCRFGIEWGELGDADACSKCGGLERAVKP